jgi:hypothetical protein
MLILQRSTSFTIWRSPRAFLPPSIAVLTARGFGASRKLRSLGKVHPLAIGKFSESQGHDSLALL